MAILNEPDTRAKLIDPKLHKSGWTEDAIQREYYLTPESGGRVILEGNVEKREKPWWLSPFDSSSNAKAKNHSCGPLTSQ